MIKIAIVEDHTLFRKGIRSLLELIDDFEIAAEFTNGRDFIDNIYSIDANIVLMDIEMPEMNGIQAANEARIKKHDLKIIALSMYSDQGYYYEMIKAGVSGFVLKEASPEELEKAIREVNNNMSYFSPELLHKAILNIPNIESKNNKKQKYKLSKREIEVLELICQGLSNADISQKLFVSPRTVETHKSNLMQKTKTKNTAGLVIFAIKNEIIEL